MTIRPFAPVLLLLVACGHSEPTVDEGLPTGSGAPTGLKGPGTGASSSAGAAGAAGASGAGGGTTGTIVRSKSKPCQQIELVYDGLLKKAQVCDPAMIPSQCVQQVEDDVACPCTTYSVGDLITVEELQSQQSAWMTGNCATEVNCALRGPCPKTPDAGVSGVCTAGVCTLPP